MEDAVLPSAKDHLEHVPRIILTGAIKQSTKKKWDAIFLDKESRVANDMTETKKDLSLVEAPLWHLPACYCDLPCRFEPYYDIVRRREGVQDEDEKFDSAQYEFNNEVMMLDAVTRRRVARVRPTSRKRYDGVEDCCGTGRGRESGSTWKHGA
ncbi:uncharacterized protein LTR77_008017 [Saxophila tyrrhenica]|uniref:Uncharacterized protein n=1 Tax=Saxophila tyrrhenica TaxID=1690608 RepID=A0AAV9P260_9PEZI|nr:hypothetical protein LTR77_008017 [Saxophila tyrrhenica]